MLASGVLRTQVVSCCVMMMMVVVVVVLVGTFVATVNSFPQDYYITGLGLLRRFAQVKRTNEPQCRPRAQMCKMYSYTEVDPFIASKGGL